VRAVVVGGDARAHALAHVLARTCESVVVSGGNAGMAALGVDVTDVAAEALDGDLFVISPEAPLVDGIADRLRAQGKRVFGPGADGARLEGSKAWMKDVVAAAGVPTARHGSFNEVEPALAFLRSLPAPFVVKTDGLAAGKGVLVTDSLAGEAFGAAGHTVVIEEGMSGAELSVLAVCDGKRAVPLAPAQDFKRARDGDRGHNTGGMGAYSPVPAAPADLVGVVMDRFVEPTLAALRDRGIDYRGTLYAGIMLTPDGPKLLEYNVRLGDPEAQVVLPRLTSDLAALLAAAADGDLGANAPMFAPNAAVCVVAASSGYPDAPRTGDRIDGLHAANAAGGVTVFCAGVGDDGAGRLVTAGGRVLSIVGEGADLATARQRAYEGIALVSWRGMHVRTDIAKAAVSTDNREAS
jgi:phosphoribosylamine--glycine ligase